MSTNIIVIDGYTLNPGDLNWDALTQYGNLTVYDRNEPHPVLERCRSAHCILTNKVTFDEATIAWGIASRFSREHPQFRWMRRTTMPYNSQLSFAFDEVREYKLSLLDEIIAYDIDGVFF